MVFQGIRTSIAKELYKLVIFQAGVRTPAPPPSGSAHGRRINLINFSIDIMKEMIDKCLNHPQPSTICADPESFVRGVAPLTS